LYVNADAAGSEPQAAVTSCYTRLTLKEPASGLKEAGIRSKRPKESLWQRWKYRNIWLSADFKKIKSKHSENVRMVIIISIMQGL
jgi:hypothetical protein